MIEIVLGLLVIVSLLATLAGAGGMLPGVSTFDPLLLLGYGGVAGVVGTGLLLVIAGVLRRAIARAPRHGHALRSVRLATAGSLAVAGFAAGPALTAEPMNLLSISAVPAGYYMAAEGALIGLVVVAFAWAARQSHLDVEEAHLDLEEGRTDGGESL